MASLVSGQFSSQHVFKTFENCVSYQLSNVAEWLQTKITDELHVVDLGEVGEEQIRRCCGVRSGTGAHGTGDQWHCDYNGYHTEWWFFIVFTQKLSWLDWVLWSSLFYYWPNTALNISPDNCLLEYIFACWLFLCTFLLNQILFERKMYTVYLRYCCKRNKW